MSTARTKRLKLVVYLRVSTDAQAQDGFGLDAQRDATARWAKSHKHRVVQLCTDEGISGTVDALDREGLGCALEAIESRKAHGLLIPRLDRLARLLTVQEAVLAHVWQRGGRVFTVDAGEVLPDDPDDPMRTAMRQMMGIFAQLDRAMIVKRLRDGRRAKAAKGGYVAGSPPFGWRAEERELVLDEAEFAVLERMRALRAAGASLRDIAEALNSEGIPSKRSRLWSASSVARTLDPAAREAARVAQARRRAWPATPN